MPSKSKSKSKPPARPAPPPRIVSGSDGQVQIQTARLLLRGAQIQHANELHQAFGDPEVMKYWSTAHHASLKQTEEWLETMTKSPENGKTDFIISYEGTAIGKVGIWTPSHTNDLAEPPGGEIGFLLAREHHRKGFMTEALTAVLPYFVNQLGYERITADVDPKNDASIDLLMKLGFRVIGRREKTFEINGEWMDSLDLELKVPSKVVETPASGVLK
ncbi:hypothetical protein FKW77_002206 [Venturia effusa]|uniref:N-acetyltransferase domain-containing protein n=1 Tax=Venturia effusa TaxID=50376 RepID=A0A517LC12_9PEZI|nr:hypothetical protein FKW77_002206 [Venturia effusa]